ncbi:hypothetical protein ON010_g15824 [Phytophthora cinnamomi]|nr:hypothetical protein ON010_g15824 [Phytophthora cinnamomi]
MFSRLGFIHESTTASGTEAELAAFLEKEAEEADPKKRKKAQKQKKKTDEDLPKLFMELKWSEQRKIGAKAPVLRQVEGDSINQRIRLYRRTIFFHIHSKLEHNGYIAQRLRLNNQNPNGKDLRGVLNFFIVAQGAEGAVRTLIHEEATIDDPDLEMRWTPLHYAVMGGHENIVERLVDKAPVRRITINRKDACGEDHAGVAKVLLRKKAFIDETDVRGTSFEYEMVSITHSPAANDAALAVEVLIQYDVSLKTRTESTNETALEMAERLRSHLVAILLYEVTYRKPQQ